MMYLTDQLEVINSATLKTTAHEVNKTGKVLTVQDLINNKKAQNKNLNIVSKMEKANDKVNNYKKLTESKINTVTQNEKENSSKNDKNKNQLKTDKTNRNTIGTVTNSISVKENNFKNGNKNTPIKNGFKFRSRGTFSNRNCFGCEIVKSQKKCNTTCSIIKNKQIGKVRKNKIKNIKTSKTSVLNRKQRKIGFKEDPNNIKKSKATVMKDIGKTTKTIRKRKKAKYTLNSSFDSSDSFNTSNMSTSSKQWNRIMKTSKQNLSQLNESIYNISRQSLRKRKINSSLDFSDSFNISSRTRSKQRDEIIDTSK